ncbi:hypothetical protein TNCT_474691 [Trichonephila clavata]|uniref:Uncharacterized protein n=1 Tax=Trichonephila clavata TaxID=2740835 RepID=A0A8X6HP60_TRICU|nr:hypothetical protein TNCT_474691 [Trichonephila clavata]
MHVNCPATRTLTSAEEGSRLEPLNLASSDNLLVSFFDGRINRKDIRFHPYTTCCSIYCWTSEDLRARTDGISMDGLCVK